MIETNSNDIKILKQSLNYINEYLGKELERGKVAEYRSNILIAISSILVTIFIFLAKRLFSNSASNGGDYNTILYILFIFSLFLVVKSIYYSIKVTRVALTNRLTPELISDIQNMKEVDGIKYEIKWKTWEYDQNIPINSKKLFYVDRAQRNLILSILILILLASVYGAISKATNLCWYIIVLIVLILISSFFDVLLDKFGIWNFEKTENGISQ